MPDEPENLALRILQETRDEMREMRADLINRIYGNTLMLNMVASLAHDHEVRITKLEGR